MASNVTDYMAHRLLDHILGNSTFSQLSNLYAGALLAEPTNAGVYSEPDDTSYLRKAINNWSDAVNRQSTNTTVLTFSAAGNAWGVMSHWGLFDTLAVGAGNLLLWGAITEPPDVAQGDTPSFPINDFVISFRS